jgi:type IV pilus assembly protein PilV
MHMIHTPAMRARPSRQAGMTLVEVLVTLVVVSIGLLGIAALQLTTLKGNQEAYVRSQASMLASYIIDRIRANQQGFMANHYNDIAMGGTGPAGTTAAFDLQRWQEEIDRLLPGGGAISGGSIARTAGSTITVTIQWSERADRVLQEGAGTVNFTTRTEI